MRLDGAICLAASAVIATTASLWGIETSENRYQRTSMASLRLCIGLCAENVRDQDHQKARFHEL